MAEGKKSILFYVDWNDTFKELSDEDAGKLIKHLGAYVNDEDPKSESGIIKALFANFKSTLKRDLKKWEARAESSRTNGKLGGRPRNPTEPSGLIDKPKKPVTDTVTVTDTVKGTVTGSVKVKEKTIPKNKFSAAKEFKVIFEAYYLELKKEKYYWTAKDAGKCKSLSAKLLFKIKEKSSAKKESWDEDIKEGFKYLLSIVKDPWILDNLSMSIIDSKFNEIIANNGKAKPTTNSKQEELRDFLQRSDSFLQGNTGG